ncbi:asparagine synthase-related protein [Paenibacillus solisilvae]|uniref:asparagine synthase (glutamine-hydrolyzing) n=1 Tax=Paenibacillus solisilvae TaxID=2486751 RepID=A0ABW0W8D1_9BACL
MSAVAGIINHNGEPVSIQESGCLMQALRRYPADDASVWHGRSIFLGCHAQWLTPESVNERLPYFDEINQLAITADAILDNRDELFGRLSIEPFRRTRMTDSELILLAYRKWGSEAPKYLIGDFAFVIWDEKARVLFGARDLLGNRTLYYHNDQRQFAFCTTIFPLLALPERKKELNESWFAEYLSIPIILDSVDYCSTVYKGINQLPPAHTVTITDGKLTLREYGALTSQVEKLKLKSGGEYEEAFREVFQEAVSSKLRTHRQVGATLSGGLDSGAVVSFAASPLREEGKTLHTYSYVPPSDFVDWTGGSRVADESPFVKATVQHVGNIRDSYLEFPGSNSFAEIDEWLELLESPYKFFENSFWIKGIFEKAEQHGIGVLLTGASGNYTISWGPAVAYYALLLKKIRWIRLYSELKGYSRRIGLGRKRVLPFIIKSAFPFLDRPAASDDQREFPSLIHPDFARRTNVFDRLQHHDVGLGRSAADAFESRENQFKKLAFSAMQGASGTKLSLRYGIWERDPTCDPRVVRFCLSVPVEQYVQNGFDRSLIRRATETYLPDKVRLNQRIRGVQGADWVHRMMPSWGAFTEEVHKLCRDSAASQYLNVHQIKASLLHIGNSPRPEHAYDPHARFLMRSLIAYRFMNRFS